MSHKLESILVSINFKNLMSLHQISFLILSYTELVANVLFKGFFLLKGIQFWTKAWKRKKKLSSALEP